MSENTEEINSINNEINGGNLGNLEMNTRPENIKEEIKEEIKEKNQDEIKEEAKVENKEEINDKIKENIKEEINDKINENIKEEINDEAKEEIKKNIYKIEAILPTSKIVFIIQIEEQKASIKISNDNPEDFYEIQKAIGEGSSGRIFLAKKRNTEEFFALKKMVVKNKHQRKLKMNEILMTILSQNPNVVEYYEMFDYNSYL